MIKITYNKQTFSLESYYTNSSGWYRKTKDGIGLKIFDLGFSSAKKAMSSRLYQRIKKEFNFQKKIHRNYPNFTSKPIDIIALKSSDGLYRLVFLMEHLKGKSFRSYGWYNKYFINVKTEKLTPTLRTLEIGQQVHDFIKNKLKSIGIDHGDLHCGNIIISPKKEIKIIDFGHSVKIK